MELRQFIYLSRLSSNIGNSGLRQIMQQSRENNPRRDLTGALLFDGESFVQLIEGSSDAVDTIIAAIAGDPRHVEFTPVCDMIVAEGQRRCAGWCNGYVESDALDLFRTQALADAAATNRQTALDGFCGLLAKADVI